MTKVIHAIYQNGALHPTEALELPEKSEVEVVIRVIKAGPPVPSLDEIYALLSESFPTGEPDLAERHNEHQP